MFIDVLLNGIYFRLEKENCFSQMLISGELRPRRAGGKLFSSSCRVVFKPGQKAGFGVSKPGLDYLGRLEKRICGLVLGSGWAANTEWWPEG